MCIMCACVCVRVRVRVRVRVCMHVCMCMCVCASTSASCQVENVLKECPLVELPLCYARSTESFCIALVCPSHVALKALGKSLGLGEDVPTLCANKQIIAEVSKQCLAVCKPKLVGFEIPKKIGLVAETWTPDNDLLTAAMKLKRIPIVAKHKAELDSLYSY